MLPMLLKLPAEIVEDVWDAFICQGVDEARRSVGRGLAPGA